MSANWAALRIPTRQQVTFVQLVEVSVSLLPRDLIVVQHQRDGCHVDVAEQGAGGMQGHDNG